MSSVSKINRIPNELLALTFATCLRGLSSDAHQPLLALICSVCRHWRDVAIEASELWTTIHITLGRRLPATQTFLERSKGCFIDVYIRGLNGNRFILAADATMITAVIAPHISRVQTLAMVLAYTDLYTKFSDAYRSIFAPNLTRLSIHLNGAGDIWKVGTYPPLFANTDSLRHFNTQGNTLNVVPSRTSLTTLELSKYSPTHIELQDLFNTSPYLETLILHHIDGRNVLDLPSEHDAAPITITAPTTLKSLAVSLYWHARGDSAISCDCVLGSLRPPNLEYLEVVGDIDIDLKAHFGSLDKLQTLRIQYCSVSFAVEEFFSSMKELRRLELVDMSPMNVRCITDPPPSKFSFPCLSSVFFSVPARYTDSSYRLLQLAERCVAAGCPRFTLEVRKGCYGEFFNTFESCIQDGHVCIIESDCSSGLIIEQDEESDGWPEWEGDDDRWGDGEDWPSDEVEDDGWGDGEEYLSDEWPEYELEDTGSADEEDDAFEFDEED